MKRLTTSIFIQESIKTHSHKYDYSQTEYKNRRTKVTIICKIHGKFTQSPYNHSKLGHGCPKCGSIATGNNQKVGIKSFISRAVKIHKHKYDYPLVMIDKQHDHIDIICRDHGVFRMKAMKHLQGQGCAKCGVISNANKRRTTLGDFIKKSNIVHNNKYIYDKCVYINNHTKLDIICKDHGVFKVTPNNHLNGTNCPGCSTNAFNQNAKTILYYISVVGKYYKIGVTNKSIRKRFHGDSSKIRVIKQWEFSSGNEAKKEERKILRKYSKFRYNGTNVLRSGNTEMFTKDILNIDIKE